ncbi:MAG: hypothetical protein Q9177_006065, partial [Variospora cf. flavescens]
EEQGPKGVYAKGVKGGRSGNLSRGLFRVGEYARYEVGEVEVVCLQRKSFLYLGSRGADGGFI